MSRRTFTTIRQTVFTGMACLFLLQGSQAAYAAAGGVEYRIAWDGADKRYHVYIRPTTTPDPDLSLTAQLTLRVPHAGGGDKFTAADIQSKDGTRWSLGSAVSAPSENPAYDYLTFVYDPIDVHAFAFKAGEEQEAFSFRNSGPCLGNVELMDNTTDPFNQPPQNPANSAGTNPNNQFASAGWGSTDDNDYLGNYGEAAACGASCGNAVQSPMENGIYYRVKWLSSDQRYHVYMFPGSLPSPNLSLTSQVTLKAPHATNTADSFKAANIQSAISGVTWSESSRINAPTEDATADYLSFTMNLTNSQAFQWQKGQELEVFSFTNSGACLGSVSLMEESDPFNVQPNSMGTNPGNQYTNLGWGASDANNYAGNYGCPAVCADPNQDSDHDGLTDGKESEIGTDPQNPDTDNDSLPDGEELQRGANPLKADVVRLQARVMLQGAYDSKTKLMQDALRNKALIPVEEPYGISKNAASHSAASSLLAASGNDAPVDWVTLELRDPSSPVTIKAQLTGLVQRDGDIMDAQSGETSFLLIGIIPGDYYVVVKHRNHLGVMTASTVTLGGTPVMIDFSKENMSAYGNYARTKQDGVALLWAGNTNADSQIIAQGPANDSGSILSKVLLTPGNNAYTTNYKLNGYQATDTNMDGVTIFAGPNNDVDLLLGNVLLHPVNGTFSSNYIIRQQLP